MEIKNIKFKAKRLDNGEWVKGDLKHSTSYVGIGYPSSAFSDVPIVHRVDPSTVCQFTGEKDMNGNEVYIGDIISNIETGSVVEVAWNDRLKRLDCKFLNADKDLDVPFGIFVARYKRIVVLRSKFDNEK